MLADRAQNGTDGGFPNLASRAHAAASANARRFYFNTLKLRLDQVKLSVLTLSHRPPELDAIKKRVGWSLMRFEDVAVELGKFQLSPSLKLELMHNSYHSEIRIRREGVEILPSLYCT